MSDKFEVRVNGVTTYEATDGHRHVVSRDGLIVFEHTQPEEPPAFDYFDPRFDMTPYELLASIARPAEFRNGKPEKWDWDAWAKATGRPNPEQRVDSPPVDRTGFELGEGASRRNAHVTGNAYKYRFTIREGGKPELVFAAAPGLGVFTKVVEDGPFVHRAVSVLRSTHHVDLTGLAPGSYNYFVTLDPEAPGREVTINIHFRQ